MSAEHIAVPLEPRARYRLVLEGQANPTGQVFYGNDGKLLLPAVSVYHLADRFVKIADREPVWQPGDVVAVNDGFHDTILVRRGDGTWACNAVDCPDTDRHDDGYLSRDWDLGDVRVLVRDGKPVTS